MVRGFFKRNNKYIFLLLGSLLVIDLTCRLAAEVLWFSEIGYLREFLLRLVTKTGLWALAFFSSSGFLLVNLVLASRLMYHPSLERNKQKQTDTSVELVLPPYPKGRNAAIRKYLAQKAQPSIPTHQPSPLKLRSLLPIVLILSALIGIVLIYYSQEALNLWSPNTILPTTPLELPPWLQQVLQRVQLQEIVIPIVQSIVLVLIILAILVNHEFWLRATAILISLLLGFLISSRWDKVLEYFYATPFNRTEPLFNRDISFYVFSLPIWELLEFWLLGLFLFGIAAVALTYFRSANSLSEGRFPGFSIPQRVHLTALSSIFMLAIALHYWLERYELLYSIRGVNYGASYTDVQVLLPIDTGLSILAVAIAIYLGLRTIVLSQAAKTALKPIPYPRQLIYVLCFYLVVVAISAKILPDAVQTLVVQPNELTRERPYIERTIALTRKAFNLDTIVARTFDPRGGLTAADLEENELTIRNIRLWDTRPLLDSNRQLQQIRPYYSFPGADIDRYTIKSTLTSPLAYKQQTIIAARELDYGEVPEQAKTWINKHLIYTHGYGFTLSPVNRVAPSGLPYYYVKDIGVTDAQNQASLQLSSPAIRASIPIGQPRIYYGEITNSYVMVRTKTQELDYPSGNDNVYNVYDGRGGIKIGSLWRRLLFSVYLRDWQMLLTRNFTPETKVLFRRNIKARVRAIAPFLRYDSDPYLVTARGEGTDIKGEPTYLYWIIDAYTTSDRYPYSDPGNNKFNYIRNSVKVVVDAYNGSIRFYVADQNDPIINTLRAVFPSLLQPLDVMPLTIRSHIRYPQDYFSVQTERLLTYHMIEPQVFYNREDLWKIPTEIYGTEPRPVDPYYLILKLPTALTEEFILLRPFTPVERPNLIAWLAARSDAEEYGNLLLYEFPKQQLVYGPQQIEALINQDPVISQQISLWNREGSRVIQGNLLIIPIEQSLLYVEPLYLEAEQNSLPTFVRVVVAYENRIVMAETLEQALSAIFQPDLPTTPAIIRPLEQPPEAQ
ncbi:MAG: UPF0182 family protein [Scytonema sp. PMC 1069.18]|nr:UPF0182 family protein [Scytonema sp. PMC 1069.18]MEC4886923.1 UPF0182 family protein [Scytonema sp. PMC 1070.18]